jgi:hypothetical protein
MELTKPSSTITAATLTGLALTLFWELMFQFYSGDIRPSLIAASVAVTAGLVGYFKKETVLGA